MRFLALLAGLIAAFGGSYGAYAAMRAVGPDNRAGDFGYGDRATVSPGGGDLFESRNFALVIAALKRELGPEGAISYLRIERTEASAQGKVGANRVDVQVDASGRSRSNVGDKADLRAYLPVSKLDPAAVDKMVRDSQEQARALVESLSLTSNNREWNVDMEDGGEPDAFIANLDGGGLRLSGEPNPVALGAAPDSLLRTANFKQVIEAARTQAGPAAKLISFDIRPERAQFDFLAGGRQLTLGYGYDAQLTGRDLSAKPGTDVPTVSWEQLDPEAIERMARTARKLLKQKLGNVQYVLLNRSFISQDEAALLMYFENGANPPYGVADLHGRHFTWPGRR